ncbi:MAG: methyltransferase domain-containing protein [Patescibacteria group bacterium]
MSNNKANIKNIINDFGKTISCNQAINLIKDFSQDEKDEVMQYIYSEQQNFWHEYANFYTYFFPKLPFVPEHIDHFVGVINPQPNETIIDLGSGYGRIIKKIIDEQPRVKKVIGLEYAKGMLLQAREVLGEKADTDQVHLIYHDVVKTFPISDNTADKVYSNWGITYCTREDLEKKVLPEIKRVLKPGGKLIIASLHAKSDMPSLRKKMSFLNVLKILGVVRKAISFGKEIKLFFPNYTVEELNNVISQNGFKIIRKEMTLFNNSITIVAEKL